MRNTRQDNQKCSIPVGEPQASALGAPLSGVKHTAKILMVNLPFSGHSNPTLGVAKELVKQGFQVSYIHSYEWKDKVTATGATFIPYVGTTPKNYQMPEFRYWRLAYDTATAELPRHDLLIYEVLFFPGKSLADRFKSLLCGCSAALH